MRHGMAVTAAAEDAVRRIAKRYQKYVGAVVAVDMAGRVGAACHGWTFKYAVRDASMDEVQVHCTQTAVNLAASQTPEPCAACEKKPRRSCTGRGLDKACMLSPRITLCICLCHLGKRLHPLLVHDCGDRSLIAMCRSSLWIRSK